jgi:hypothetical protein
MDYPLKEVFACVRQSVTPQTAFNALRQIGKAHFKSYLWDAVALPDTETYFASAAVWFR